MKEKIQGRYNELPYLDSNSAGASNFIPSRTSPTPQKQVIKIQYCWKCEREDTVWGYFM